MPSEKSVFVFLFLFDNNYNTDFNISPKWNTKRISKLCPDKVYLYTSFGFSDFNSSDFFLLLENVALILIWKTSKLVLNM